jgi:hypothetical protein
MNREIEYISTITSAATLTSTAEWLCTEQIPIADEVRVRQITYSTALSNNFNFLVRANGRVIGSIPDVTISISPNTRIQLHSHNAQLRFQLQLANGSQAASAIGDSIAITLEFIKYRK